MVCRLKSFSFDLFPQEVKSLIAAYKYSLNPSFIRFQEVNYLAIRLYDEERKGIIAKLYVWKDGGPIKSVDLSDFFLERVGTSKVADPKLFIMNNKVWGTFNTGYVDKINNEVGLFELSEEQISNYYFCSYDQRTRIEKNWAFYSKNDEIYCLYGISPLRILKVKEKANHGIEFEMHHQDKEIDFDSYTIGTPLSFFNDAYYFIGHKKFYRKGKRLYLGRPFKLELGDRPNVSSKRVFLFHNIRSLFGNKFKFNKNLISCTYFSGIQIVDNKAYLTYGINDINWNTAVIKIKRLWQ